MKTVSGKEINATPNYSKRTFTIRTGDGNKYRTIPMNVEEFEENENNTANDWQQFLTYTQDYTVIK